MTTFHDRDNDTLDIRHGFVGQHSLKLVTTQAGKTTVVIFEKKGDAERIRDRLIEMFPLPKVTAEVEPAMTSIGEVAAFAPAQGITINIANLTLNA